MARNHHRVTALTVDRAQAAVESPTVHLAHHPVVQATVTRLIHRAATKRTVHLVQAQEVEIKHTVHRAHHLVIRRTAHQHQAQATPLTVIPLSRAVAISHTAHQHQALAITLMVHLLPRREVADKLTDLAQAQEVETESTAHPHLHQVTERTVHHPTQAAVEQHIAHRHLAHHRVSMLTVLHLIPAVATSHTAHRDRRQETEPTVLHLIRRREELLTAHQLHRAVEQHTDLRIPALEMQLMVHRPQAPEVAETAMVRLVHRAAE
mmetsp:Transcript_40343/g.64667  ORF Transcript_40343/g.64667 Transcript_40343/m.64667 type:complete len:264 (+) Transcript_40343:554-1345(+)